MIAGVKELKNLLLAKDPTQYGYLREIQEPTVIKDAGTLVKLNGALDDCKQIELSTGEIIHRHPNCIVVMTTNMDYDGCKSLTNPFLAE